MRGRVTWIQRPRTVRELFQIGIELEVGGNVWGIAFPPADWFPFPESGVAPSLEMSAEPQPAGRPHPEDEDWSKGEFPNVLAPGNEQESVRLIPSAAEPTEDNVRVIPSVPAPGEGNVRVLPLPAGEDQSMQLARQVARLVAEAKLQIQSISRESATIAVAAETRPLLAALQTQLQDAAQKSVLAAAATQLEKLQAEAAQQMDRERETGMAAMLESNCPANWKAGSARPSVQIDSQMAEVERTRRANFEEQIQGQIQTAIQRMESLSGNFAKESKRKSAQFLDQLRESSSLAAADEIRRWKEQVDLQTADAQARLAQMEQSAKKLAEQIAATTTIGEVGWRGLLEADLEGASTRWQGKMEASIEEATQRAAEQIAKNSEASAQQIEQQLQQRMSTLGDAHSQITAEAESTLNTLQATINREAVKGEALIAKFQESISQLEAQRSEFSAVLQSASDEWMRRGAAMLETQSLEMNRRAETAVAGMAQRLQPLLETAGRDSIEKLAGRIRTAFRSANCPRHGTFEQAGD